MELLQIPEQIINRGLCLAKNAGSVALDLMFGKAEPFEYPISASITYHRTPDIEGETKTPQL